MLTYEHSLLAVHTEVTFTNGFNGVLMGAD